MNTQKRAVRGHIGRKERGDRQDVPEGARNPDESRRDEKGRDHIITNGKTYKINNKGTEYRGNLSLFLGMEPHHPIMSKLWDLGDQN